MTRIIAGAAGGLRLRTPAGGTTRPTSDRVREALFSRLDSRGLLAGARVLDLFSGSGALGLEAVSRGAAAAVLVDQSRPASDAARANVRASGLAGVTVSATAVARYLAGEPGDVGFDVVFLDPPYDLPEEELAQALDRLAAGWLAHEAVVIVERSSRTPEPTWPQGWEAEPVRTYGETAVWTAWA